MEKTFTTRYIVLESNVAYDWDDYDVYADILFDTAENKVITCKYGHGVGPKITGPSIADAVKNGIVDCAVIIDAMLAQLHISMPDMYSYAANFSMERPLGIPVVVKGGRKFKGEGYLVYAEREPVRYGLGAYHNEYHHYPVIYDPKTKTFNKVNSFSYLEYGDDTKAAIAEGMRKNIKDTIAEVCSLAHAWAYDISYSACDRRNYVNLLEQYSRRGMSCIEVPECVKEGIEIFNEQKRVAREKLKAEKMPDILKWVAEKTDKTGNYAIELAEHIFNKKY